LQAAIGAVSSGLMTQHVWIGDDAFFFEMAFASWASAHFFKDSRNRKAPDRGGVKASDKSFALAGRAKTAGLARAFAIFSVFAP